MFLGLAREWLHGPLMLASDWPGKNLNKTVRLAPGANFKLLLGSILCCTNYSNVLHDFPFPSIIPCILHITFFYFFYIFKNS
jgi:hypothetical protein